MTWCQKREAFGMTLIEQPVVRHKFGHMARQIDGLQSWTESVVYELDHLSHAKGTREVGGDGWGEANRIQDLNFLGVSLVF